MTAPVDEAASARTECRKCNGYGWHADHEDICYETGDCCCSGVQVECEQCDGLGAA